MGNGHFYGKPRHVTPQIDHLGETCPVLSVPTAIYADSKQMKMFIFQLNLSM